MKNAEWMQKKGYKFKDLRIYKNYTNDKSWDYRIEIAKTDAKVHVKGNGQLNTLMRWLDAEHVEPILDEVEKRYLASVIRPFRDRVWYIMKSFSVDKASCYIFIRFNDGSSDMEFPVFRKSDMYKGMKICKAYTLDKLGL